MVRTYRHNNTTLGLGFFGDERTIAPGYAIVSENKYRDKSSSTEDLMSPCPPCGAFSDDFAKRDTSTAATAAVEAASRLLSAAADISSTIKKTDGENSHSFCRNCRRFRYAQNNDERSNWNSHRSLDYGDLLNHKRREENEFNLGRLRSSTSVDTLSKINELPKSKEGEDMTEGLKELSGTIYRLQGAAAEAEQSSKDIYQNTGRKTWSAPTPNPFDPSNQTHQSTLKADSSDTQGEYHPSLYGSASKRSDRGMGAVSQDSSYLRDLETQILTQKMRREKEKNALDWWEKKSNTLTFNGDHLTMHSHPSQTTYQRPSLHSSRKTYERELKEQMETKKLQEELRKKEEREEEEKIDRRIREQQDRMKREYEEELNRKKAKENAKLKRQQEMEKQHEEIRREAETRRREAAERRFQERKAAREAFKVQDTIYTPPPPLEFRSDSPPIPALRGAVSVSQRTGTSSNCNEEPYTSSKRSARRGIQAPKNKANYQLDEMLGTLQKQARELSKEDFWTKSHGN